MTTDQSSPIDDERGLESNDSGASTGDGPDTITLYADYVCPFCYLGRQSLERYRESRAEPLAIDWHPFDLRRGKRNPDGSIDHDADDGKDDEYFEQARENVRRLQERYDVEMVQDLAIEVDSYDAQLASLAVASAVPERWEAFDVAIYDTLWQDGRDIGDHDVLLEIADEVGVSSDVVREALDDEDEDEDERLRSRLEELFSEAGRAGVRGVPTFVYDGYAAQGAVPPEHLERLVEGEDGAEVSSQ
ncbi:DsbA family oxidoreductase [Natronosalvus caseinilyticus]|uniref:DsbA family oxidoreductase n=1 Tax=Natronosalvus caseinilyticus TaxID=2953747 RepID=UPI0028B06754|nr:DsbA family protein [Natronosalvus caseinilyticus]